MVCRSRSAAGLSGIKGPSLPWLDLDMDLFPVAQLIHTLEPWKMVLRILRLEPVGATVEGDCDQVNVMIYVVIKMISYHFEEWHCWTPFFQLVAAPPCRFCFQWAPCVELERPQVDSMTQHCWRGSIAHFDQCNWLLYYHMISHVWSNIIYLDIIKFNELLFVFPVSPPFIMFHCDKRFETFPGCFIFGDWWLLGFADGLQGDTSTSDSPRSFLGCSLSESWHHYAPLTIHESYEGWRGKEKFSLTLDSFRGTLWKF